MFQQRSQKPAFIETHWKRIHRFQKRPLHSNENIAGKLAAIKDDYEDYDDDDKNVAIAFHHQQQQQQQQEQQQHHLIHKFKLKKFKNLIFTKKMANTLSVMTNVLRNAVSKQRIRYNKNGFNLDLAYICDNIIAMGYPADNLESIYRNRLEDVYKFLEENHQDHYKIYNLCLERSYDKNKFHGRVSVYPFEDHNPPTIELIQKFCKDVHDWLNADRQNVAAVHCKAGKGRTGTMICCYLVYSGKHSTAEEALSYYGEKRTRDLKGVTIPSQRRYVQYFTKLHRSNITYEKCTLQICEIRFTEANALHNQGTVHCSISVLQDTSCGAVKVEPLHNMCIDFRKGYVVDLKHIDLEVAGDIKIELNSKTSRKKIFHFWVNTFFIKNDAANGKGDNEHYIYTLYKNEIDDAHKDKEHKCYPEDFKIELVFVENKSPKHTNSNNATGNRISNTNNQNTISSFERLMGGRHHVNSNSSYAHTQAATATATTTTQISNEMNYHCDQRSSSSSASVSSLLGGSGGLNSSTELNNTTITTTTTDRLKRTSNGNAANINTDIMHRPLSLPVTAANKLRSSGGTETLTDYNYMTTTTAATTNNALMMAKLKEHQHLQQQQYQPSENNVAIVPPSKVSRGSNHILNSSNATNELTTNTTTTTIGYGKTTSNINLPNNLTKNGIGGVVGSHHHHHQQQQQQQQHNHWKDDNKDQDSYELDGDDNDVGEDWESGESSVKPFSHITTKTTTTTTKSFFHNKNSSPKTQHKHQQQHNSPHSQIHLPPISSISSIIPNAIFPTLLSQNTNDDDELVRIHDKKNSTDSASSSSISNDATNSSSSNLHKINMMMMGYQSMNLVDNEITNTSLSSSRSSYSSKAQIGGDNNNGNESSVSASQSPTSSYASLKNVVNNIDDGNNENDNDYNNDNDDDEEKIKQNISKNIKDLKKVQTTTTTNLDTKSNANNQASIPTATSISTTTTTCNITPASAGSRNKFFPFSLNKSSQNAINNTRTTTTTSSSSSTSTSVVSSPKQPFFRRKSFKSLANNAASAPNNSDVKDGSDVTSSATAAIETSSSINGLASLSKQKLKIKYKKNRFKLAQKFQKLQNYLRNDPDEFCENFVQQTIAMRRNSNCSINSRNHKTINTSITTTATSTSIATPPPSLTKLSVSPDFKTFNYDRRNNETTTNLQSPLPIPLPPQLPPPLAAMEPTSLEHLIEDVDEESPTATYEELLLPIHSSSSLSPSATASNASLGSNSGCCEAASCSGTGNNGDDYYSSICDNQLSFNNSPCKSPRSIADIALISGGGGASSSLGSPTTQLRLNQHHYFHQHHHHLHHHQHANNNNHHHYHHNQHHHLSNQHQQQQQEKQQQRTSISGCSVELQQTRFQQQNKQQRQPLKQTDIVVVAAKPAIGFNVKTPIDCIDGSVGDSEVSDNKKNTEKFTETNLSDLKSTSNVGDCDDDTTNSIINERSSVYFTPPTSLISTENEIFTFLNQEKSTENALTTSSFNFTEISNELRNVESKELTPSTTAQSTTISRLRENFNLTLKLKEHDEVQFDSKIQLNKSKTPSTDEASLESIDHGNSSTSGTTATSSSGFSNSDCFCFSNDSNINADADTEIGAGGIVSGICNCNPFNLDLERYTNAATAAKQNKSYRHNSVDITEADEAVVDSNATTIATTNRSINISKTE